MSELLAIEGLTAGYGEAKVLREISLTVGEGQSLALLGRNGMGKTTLLNSIVGAVGGGIGGQILTALIPVLAGSNAFDLGPLLGQVAGGGISGAILTVIAGALKNKLAT